MKAWIVSGACPNGAALARKFSPHMTTTIPSCDASTASATSSLGDLSESTQLQALLAAIVESSDDAIISKTLNGTICTWNGAAERMFGYTPQEAIGQPITLIIPRDRQHEEREILTRIAAGDRVDHFETVRLSKSGRLLQVSLMVSPVRDTVGRITGASKIARDITGQKQSERDIIEQKRIEEALRQADVRKDEFIALLAHELRNPLAPLRNGLHIMRLASGDAVAVGKAREMMERQLSHMVRLIDDLLDTSRINQRKLELRRANVLLADVVSTAVETVRHAIDGAGHVLTVSLPTEPVYLNADLTRLSQVFSNLLLNSAKYTPPGGRILFAAVHDPNAITVTVRDSGIGIPADAIPRVFDMFSQVDRTMERVTGGLGIGLALVKGFVELHGGTVHAASDGQGCGSVFTVRLPIHTMPVDVMSTKPVELFQRASNPRRILVADDNEDSACSMSLLLQVMGHEVITASDGIEAVELANSARPQMILIDLGMPGLNGYEATKRIRREPWAQDVVIVALTGWGQDTDRANSQAAGCDGHMVKPVGLAELQKVLLEFENGRAVSAPRQQRQKTVEQR